MRRLGGTVLALERLAPEEVGELLRAAAPDAAPELAARLYEETEGLPFLLVEYLNSLGAEPDWALPAGARELLLARLDPVSETGRQVLAAAAVIGRSFEVDTVRAASGRGDEETVGALEELVRRGLVREGALRLRLRPRAAARGWSPRRPASRGGGCCTAARRTRWRAVRPAPPRSRATCGWPGATPRPPPPTAAPPSTRARCSPTPRRSRTCAPRSRSGMLSRGRCTWRSETCRRCRASTRLRSRRMRRPRPSPPPPSSARSSTGSARSATAAASGRSPTAHFEAALAATPEDELAARARICADLSLSAHDGGDPARAAELAERARAMAEEAGDPRALGQAHNLLGALATSGGAAADASEHLGRSLQLAEATGDPGARVAALNNLALAHRARGELDAGARADPRRAGAVRRAGRSPPRGGAAQQPRRPPARRRPPRRRDGRAQARGGDLRRGRCGG